MIEEVQPAFSEKMSLTINKAASRSFAKFSLWDYEFWEDISENVYRVTLYTDKIVHWDLGATSPVGSFGVMSLNLKKNHI